MKLQLKALRKKGSMTQQALADLLQVDIGTIGNWERGKTMMSIEQLCNCCEALGCTPNDMTGWYLEHPAPGVAVVPEPGEASLVSAYRDLSEEGREVAVNVVAGMRSTYPQEPDTHGVDTEEAV
ncbi:MAG: helix-turn-helix transcriptional regulator [Atopobiaceae bacterium]|nr:helix-turn-helix transcriptional regulator [Atopobiaceae bacterium]